MLKEAVIYDASIVSHNPNFHQAGLNGGRTAQRPEVAQLSAEGEYLEGYIIAEIRDAENRWLPLYPFFFG